MKNIISANPGQPPQNQKSSPPNPTQKSPSPNPIQKNRKAKKIPNRPGASANVISPVSAVSPMNLLEFTCKFPDEKACREYLSLTRWANGFLCPRCGSIEFYFHSRRDIRICKYCKHQLSLTSGTIFHKTRTPLLKWFWIIYHISIQKVGISALALKRMLDIPGYQTVWTICHKIRKAMTDENIRDRNSCSLNIPAIPGISGIIEIDNTYLGATKQKPALTPEKDLISLDMDIKFTDMKVLPQGFVLPVLQQMQNKKQNNTTFRFISSKNIVYKPKGKKKPKKTVNQSQSSNIGGQDPTMHWVSVMVNNLRTNLHGTFHCIGDKHLQRFIDEYCYKFNRRKKPEEIFDQLLSSCVRTSTILYNELIR